METQDIETIYSELPDTSLSKQSNFEGTLRSIKHLQEVHNTAFQNLSKAMNGKIDNITIPLDEVNAIIHALRSSKDHFSHTISNVETAIRLESKLTAEQRRDLRVDKGIKFQALILRLSTTAGIIVISALLLLGLVKLRLPIPAILEPRSTLTAEKLISKHLEEHHKGSTTTECKPETDHHAQKTQNPSGPRTTEQPIPAPPKNP